MVKFRSPAVTSAVSYATFSTVQFRSSISLVGTSKWISLEWAIKLNSGLIFGFDTILTHFIRVEKIEVDEHGLLVIKGNPNDTVDFDMKRG